MLNPAEDPLVKDCRELFHRTLKDNCGKDFHVKVKTAQLNVVDGFDVHMGVEITGPAGKKTYHNPQCAFEIDPESEDAKLLQVSVTDPEPKDTIPASQKLQEEKQGMEATLVLHGPLCTVDMRDGITAEA